MALTHVHWRRPDLERSGTLAIRLDDIGVEVSSYVVGGARPQFDDALKVFEAALDSLRPDWREAVRSRYNRIGKFRVRERGGMSGCADLRMVRPDGSMGERTIAQWYISCRGRIGEWMHFPLEAMPVMWPSSRASEDLVIRVLGEPQYEAPKALEYWGTSDWMPEDEFDSESIMPPSRTLEPLEDIVVRVPLEALEE